MKVKLLKKIRKRYSITHYPNGVFLYGDFEEGPLTLLTDSENKYRLKTSKNKKSEAYENLYTMLMKWIEKDYGPFNSKKRKKHQSNFGIKNKGYENKNMG
jgi:hypothetical protein